MLRLFFQGIEQTLGPALSTLATIVYGSGLVVVLAAALRPLYWRWAEYFAMGYGLQQVWVMTCQACGRTTRAAGHRCGYCDERLELPAMLKLWSGATRRRPSIRAQTARWWLHLVASVVFLLLSAWLILTLDALEPAGSLHSLFLGFGLLAWASAGWFAGRAGRLVPMGPLGRLRDGALALAFVGFVAVTAFLAEQAKPVAETVLVTFEAKPGRVEVDNRLVETPTNEIVFEYLQLDHEVLGYHGVIPLAFTGSTRLPFPHAPLTVALIRHLSANPDEYAARGLTVRFRSDRHRLTPGYAYEIVDRAGQALIRRVRQGSVAGRGGTAWDDRRARSAPEAMSPGPTRSRGATPVVYLPTCAMRISDSAIFGSSGASSRAFLKCWVASPCLSSLSSVRARLKWATARLGSASTALRKCTTATS